jgi:hypothetical protein
MRAAEPWSRFNLCLLRSSPHAPPFYSTLMEPSRPGDISCSQHLLTAPHFGSEKPEKHIKKRKWRWISAEATFAGLWLLLNDPETDD